MILATIIHTLNVGHFACDDYRIDDRYVLDVRVSRHIETPMNTRILMVDRGWWTDISDYCNSPLTCLVQPFDGYLYYRGICPAGGHVVVFYWAD